MKESRDVSLAKRDVTEVFAGKPTNASNSACNCFELVAFFLLLLKTTTFIENCTKYSKYGCSEVVACSVACSCFGCKFVSISTP